MTSSLTDSEIARTGVAASSDVVLRASGINLSFGGQLVLDDVSVELRRGQVVLLRGDNGSGKTTLLNVLTGSLTPDTGSIEVSSSSTIGRFAFPRAWWRQFGLFDHFTPERLARTGVSRTWQEIRLFSSQSLGDNIALATPGMRGENPLSVLFAQRLVRREAHGVATQARALLERFGLADRKNSLADQVSLGQAKRVAIARSIQAGGRILFLDEPLAGLDVAGIRDVVAFMSALVKSGDLTLVIVEHVFNIPLILQLADVVWTLAGGRLTVERPEQAYGAAPVVEGDLTKWVMDSNAHEQPAQHVELPGGARLSLIDRPRGADANPPIFALRDVVVQRGKRQIVGRAREDGSYEGLSLTLHEGSLAILQAPNGWGKTTLVEALAGFIPVGHGTIELDGHAIEGDPTWTRAERGLAVLQSRNHSFDNLSVSESLRLAGADDRRDGFTALLRRRSGDLSGGQKQQIAIASALANKRNRVRILDEPFSMLDASTINIVRSTIANMTTGATLIFVPAARAF